MNPDQKLLELISPVWAEALMAIAQRKGASLSGVLDEAIALYIRQQTLSQPSLSAGLSYEDLENEPDEILWEFLDKPQSSAAQTAQIPPGNDPEDDEPDEVLPGFLDG